MQQPRGHVLATLEQSNPYHAMIIEGIRSVFETVGAPLLLVSRDPSWVTPAPSLVRALAALRPVGVLTTTLMSAQADAQIRNLLTARDDLVTVHLGAATEGCCVRADNAAGIHDVVAHLVDDCQVARPALVRGLAHHPDSLDRERAAREAFAARGIMIDDDLCLDGGFDRARSYVVMTDLLRRRRDFDAVLAFNDRSAFGAVDALLHAGLRVPQDIVVTGFDDEDAAELSRPPLTSVNQCLFEQGAQAAELLLRAVAGQAPRSVLVPTRLVVRASTARGPRGTAEAPAVQLDSIRALTDRLWTEVGVLDTYLAMTRSFMACHDLPDVLRALSAALPRLAVTRCVLVLFERIVTDVEARSDPPGRILGTVALVCRDGVVEEVTTGEPFDVADLLPQDLQVELATGALTLQPLSTEAGELGYLLLEYRDADRVVGEAIRMDLSRTIAMLARNTELAEHAQTLEEVVAARTGELRAEVASRRRAEDELRFLNDALRSRLHLDGLTGICNRVAFDEALAGEWAATGPPGQPLSVLMVDVDHFKDYNDTYGHLAGDQCLRVIARCLRGAVRRANDLVARYGGEEFALVLPDSTPAQAREVAERIRSALAAEAIAHRACPLGVVTVSVGTATGSPSSSAPAESLVAAADAALYAAKAAGRDRVISAEPDGAAPARSGAAPPRSGTPTPR